MKRLSIYRQDPAPEQVQMAREFGTDAIELNLPETMREHLPLPAGYALSDDTGSLIKMAGCVLPHTDQWIGRGTAGPRAQRSLFWVLSGAVHIKVDGFGAAAMLAGDWVVFDHRREHMVLADGEWLGVAIQIAPIREKAGAA